jgi:CBS domain
LISACLTRGFQYRGSERGLLTCFQDTDLTTAKELMEAKGIKQLPVVKRGKSQGRDGKRRLVGLLYYDSIGRCLRLVTSFSKNNLVELICLCLSILHCSFLPYLGLLNRCEMNMKHLWCTLSLVEQFWSC